jgi:hypothetical protein
MSNGSIPRGFGCFSFLSCTILLGGCADDTVNLGGGRATQEIKRGERCSSSPILAESVRVTQQSELAELAGCEEIAGDLLIDVFAGADLSPLASLRVVEGTLELGAYPAFPDEIEPQRLAEIREQVDQVVADGYLASLAGLERLERAGSLDFYFLAAENLEPLLGLRELAGMPTLSDRMPEGFLGIHSTALRSLQGLQNVDGIEHLVLSDNFELEDLGGIQLAPALVNINLVESPKLTSIAELASVEQTGTLYLINLGIEDLEGLASLFIAESSIVLAGNRHLVDVERLSELTTSSLFINENAVLQTIPALPGMTYLDSFMAVGNPELETITLDLPVRGSGPDSVQGETLTDPIKLFDIGQNDKLTRISLTLGLKEGRFLAIYENPLLSSLALGTLTRLEELSIEGNPSLTTVDLGELQTVESLSVIDNPTLVTAPLAGLRTFEETFEGNADAPPDSP